MIGLAPAGSCAGWDTCVSRMRHVDWERLPRRMLSGYCMRGWIGQKCRLDLKTPDYIYFNRLSPV